MTDLINIQVGTASLIGLSGYLVVFFGLALLMLVVMLLDRIMLHATKHQHDAAPVPDRQNVLAQPPESEGEIELYGVHPRDAAVIMAIVADRLGKPLEELRFKSIKEVNDR